MTCCNYNYTLATQNNVININELSLAVNIQSQPMEELACKQTYRHFSNFNKIFFQH